jgi:hypothetical protein
MCAARSAHERREERARARGGDRYFAHTHSYCASCERECRAGRGCREARKFTVKGESWVSGNGLVGAGGVPPTHFMSSTAFESGRLWLA